MTLNLSLQACVGNFVKFNQRKKNKKFKEVSRKIASSCGHHCQYCNIYCEGWSEIVNIDNDYSNNVHSNLVLACRLCSNCLLMDQYNLNYCGQDKLIYLPELRQVDLNLLIIAMSQVTSSEDHVAGSILKVKTAYSYLSSYADLLKTDDEADLSHPGMFTYISSLEVSRYKLISGLRLILPIDTVTNYVNNLNSDKSI